LLSEVLSRHDDVFVAPETKYFQHVFSRRWLLRLLPRRARHKKIVELLIEHEYSGAGPTFPRFREAFTEALATAPNETAAFLALIRSLSPKPVIGEKTPWHTFFVNELLSAAPRAKVIGISRDAPAVTASLLGRAGFRRARTITQCVARWRLVNNEVLRLKRDMPADQFYLLRFEDLVASPQETLEPLCAWLGVDFAPAMQSPCHQDSSLREARAQATAGGFDSGALQRWKTKLTPLQIDRINGLTSDIAMQLGYERAPGSADWRDRLAVRVEYGLQRLGVALMRSGFYFVPRIRRHPTPDT
jgi:hypothetical protein